MRRLLIIYFLFFLNLNNLKSTIVFFLHVLTFSPRYFGAFDSYALKNYEVVDYVAVQRWPYIVSVSHGDGVILFVVYTIMLWSTARVENSPSIPLIKE